MTEIDIKDKTVGYNIIKLLSGGHKDDIAVVMTLWENTYQVLGYFRGNQIEEAEKYKQFFVERQDRLRR